MRVKNIAFWRWNRDVVDGQRLTDLAVTDVVAVDEVESEVRERRSDRQDNNGRLNLNNQKESINLTMTRKSYIVGFITVVNLHSSTYA